MLLAMRRHTEQVFGSGLREEIFVTLPLESTKGRFPSFSYVFTCFSTFFMLFCHLLADVRCVSVWCSRSRASRKSFEEGQAAAGPGVCAELLEQAASRGELRMLSVDFGAAERGPTASFAA